MPHCQYTYQFEVSLHCVTTDTSDQLIERKKLKWNNISKLSVSISENRKRINNNNLSQVYRIQEEKEMKGNSTIIIIINKDSASSSTNNKGTKVVYRANLVGKWDGKWKLFNPMLFFLCFYYIFPDVIISLRMPYTLKYLPVMRKVFIKKVKQGNLWWACKSVVVLVQKGKTEDKEMYWWNMITC